MLRFLFALMLMLAPAPALAQAAGKPLHEPCTYVEKAMQAAHEGFWALGPEERPFGMVGQNGDGRGRDMRTFNSGMIYARFLARRARYKDARRDYDRLVAAISACVVTIDQRPYGLEALIEPDPVDKDEGRLDAVFRLRNAPDYLSYLQVLITTEGYGSAWTLVQVGGDFNDGEMARQAYRLTRRGIAWRPVSSAPDNFVRFAELDVAGLIARGDALYARSGTAAGKQTNFVVQALPYFHEACTRGSEAGCGKLGLALDQAMHGDGKRMAANRARDLLRRGCATGDVGLCGAYALNLRQFSHALQRDYPVALAAMERACGMGHAATCNQMGLDRIVGHLGQKKEDFAGAAVLFDKGCNAGGGEACWHAGMTYYKGQPGVAEDQVRARRYLLAGCEAGHRTACRDAATMLYHGRGGPADQPRAHALVRSACRLGDREACEATGITP